MEATKGLRGASKPGREAVLEMDMLHTFKALCGSKGTGDPGVPGIRRGGRRRRVLDSIRCVAVSLAKVAGGRGGGNFWGRQLSHLPRPL